MANQGYPPQMTNQGYPQQPYSYPPYPPPGGYTQYPPPQQRPQGPPGYPPYPPPGAQPPLGLQSPIAGYPPASYPPASYPPASYPPASYPPPANNQPANNTPYPPQPGYPQPSYPPNPPSGYSPYQPAGYPPYPAPSWQPQGNPDPRPAAPYNPDPRPAAPYNPATYNPDARSFNADPRLAGPAGGYSPDSRPGGQFGASGFAASGFGIHSVQQGHGLVAVGGIDGPYITKRQEYGLKFFNNLQSSLRRDYTLIVDKSGSMQLDDGNKNRWDEARKAVEFLAPFICQFDPDGPTVWFFSRPPFHKHPNITNAQQVKELFAENVPDGSTDLAGVLRHALRDHFAKGSNETMLVITDGSPDCEEDVEEVIIGATSRLRDKDELSISFIQIGSDPAARDYLKRLDCGLQAKGAVYDIVDTKTCDQMVDMSFSELIFKSLTS
eukprot:TRINITY_DN159_c0_g1_i2.p1 TRINITY_DN159_c0_g1~~TRINITY_DN159_c0_g1_i2.p1  ORF type:complete len:447 (+),score=66.66 TRINITY_DN159_c0_g1_i2:30-1343(+)